MVSRATPTTISTAVLWMVSVWMPVQLPDEEGQHGDDTQEERARHGDANQHRGQILMRLSARPDARDEAVLPLQVLGDVLLLEDNQRIEEGERDDQDEVEHPVDRVRGVERVVDELGDVRHDVAVAGQEVAGDDRPGRMSMLDGEDQRDHARRVHLERNVRRATAVDAIAADLFGDLDRDAPLALVHEDDRDDRDDGQHGEDEQRGEVDAGGEALEDLEGQAGHDAAEDDDRHALTDAVLRDQLAHPDQQHGAGGHRDDDGQRAERVHVEAEVLDDLAYCRRC